MQYTVIVDRFTFIWVVVFALPSVAFAQDGVIDCPPAPTVVGKLLQRVSEAHVIANKEREEIALDGDFSDLEKRVVDALRTMDSKDARILDAKLDPHGAKPEKGFTRNRELAYDIALDLYARYGYAFVDEDAHSQSLDHAELSRSTMEHEHWSVARWRTAELYRARALLEAMGPLAKGLPIRRVIRDDRFSGKHAPGDVRIFSVAFEQGDVSFEQIFARELSHAFFEQHPQMLERFAKLAGWKDDARPVGYDGYKYWQMSVDADASERMSFHVFELLDGMNPRITNRKPAAGPPGLNRFFRGLVGAVPLRTKPEWKGVTIGKSTVEDVIKLHGPTDLNKLDDIKTGTLGWDALDDHEGRYKTAVLFEKGVASSMLLNVEDQKLTTDALTKAFGEPTRLNPEIVVYWDRLLLVHHDADGDVDMVAFGQFWRD